MAGNVTIFRTSNPVDFTLVDGVFIDERRPPGRIRGIGNDIACVIGEFERGPVDEIVEIGNTSDFSRIFGGYGPDANGLPYKGYLSVVGKQFARLRVIRVSNSTMVTATRTITDGAGVPVNVLRIDAASPGRWGNNLTVQVTLAIDGVASHFDVAVLLNGVPQENHRGLDLAQIADNETFGITSDLIKITRLAAGDGIVAPDVAAAALTGGADGTFGDSDYTGSPSNSKGMRLLYGSGATAIRWVWVAENTAPAVLAALRTLAEETKTKIVVICGAQANTKAQALSDVVSYRSDRVIYVYPWVKVFVPEANGGKGGLLNVAPTSFAVAACAALAPGTDPAGVNAEPFLTGIRDMNDKTLSAWNDYVSFNERGIMALQFTAERQRYSFRSGVLTTLDTSLLMIHRRTMADFLQESIAARLTQFQNKPLKRSTKIEIQAEIENFLDGLVNEGLLPSRFDLEFGDGTRLDPYEVDIDSANNPADEAIGKFVVILRVRIFASMRHIVLRTEIGQGVEIDRSVREAA